MGGGGSSVKCNGGSRAGGEGMFEEALKSKQLLKVVTRGKIIQMF